MVDLLRVESNERVDLIDFQFALNDAMAGALREVGANFLTNPNGSVLTWILGGFGMTNPLGKQLTVTKGRALLGRQISGITRYGMVTADGDTSKTVDMTALTPGTYNVYIRFEYIDTDSTSRVFWDPAGSGKEFTQTVPTRLQANWSMRVETSSPGSEWTKIGTANNSGGSLALVDMRKFYFEGAVDTTYASGWSTDGGGAATDRNVDRRAYGVMDLQSFTAATRQCLEDIKGRGLRRWYSRDIGGMNIGFDADPVEDQLAVHDADFVLRGSSATPDMVFDHLGGSEDRFRYDRMANQYAFNIGGVTYSTVDYLTLRHVSKVRGDKGVEGYGNTALATPGVYGENDGATMAGVSGYATGTGPGVYGFANGTGRGVVGLGGSANSGVYGTGGATSGRGVEGHGTGTGAGVYGAGGVNNAIGVEGLGGGTNSIGVKGTGTGLSPGIRGQASATGPGIDAFSSGSGAAMYAEANGTGPAIYGKSATGASYGGRFEHTSGVALRATATSGKAAEFANTTATTTPTVQITSTSGKGLSVQGASNSPGVSTGIFETTSIYGEALVCYSRGSTAIGGFSGEGGDGVIGSTASATGTSGYGVMAQGKSDPHISGRAAFRIVPQTGLSGTVFPATLEDGAIWICGGAMFVRLNGSVRQIQDIAPVV